MCLPRIDRIASIDGDEAVTEHGGTGPISLLCVPTAKVGDHVMIHAGHAIQILDPAEAAERQSMIATVRGEGLCLSPSLSPKTDDEDAHDPSPFVM